jgi:hypothetical protein
VRSPVETALAPIVATLEADGYGAVVTESSGVVHFRVTAGPDACEDCLSPRDVMEPIIVNVLRRSGMPHRLELSYPDET